MTRPKRAARRRAGANSSSVATLAAPKLEPSCTGFTMSGRPSSWATARALLASASSSAAGVGSPSARQTALLNSLSMASAEAETPLPV